MTVNQAQLFLIYTMDGVFIGFIFDFFRILRKGFKTNTLVTNMEDIVFWILAGLSIIYSMVNFSNGILRSYMVMGIFIGYTTYMLTISKYIMKFSISVIFILKKIIQNIWKIILYPLKFLYETICIPLKNIAKIIYMKINKIFLRQKAQKKYHLNLKYQKK